MAHHKSAIKRIRTNLKANLRNRHYRSMLRTAIRRVREAGAGEASRGSLAEAYSLIDKLVIKGILHRNTAARRKAHLARTSSGSKPAS
ncbi:MAG: 30S ribosomal protein S20 [Calditrichaeota bacterium]|nr:30S ribosomal protein S20 [Calditrichota bacterium]